MTCFDSPDSDDGSGDGSSATSLKLPESRFAILSAVRPFRGTESRPTMEDGRSDIFVSSARGSSAVNWDCRLAFSDIRLSLHLIFDIPLSSPDFISYFPKSLFLDFSPFPTLLLLLDLSI